jgi:CRP-like cAMP-binding protein
VYALSIVSFTTDFTSDLNTDFTTDFITDFTTDFATIAMDNAERYHLARQVRELHVPSNTLVIRQGAVANDFFVIYSGSLRPQTLVS